ncbi:rod shape-determining protein [Bilophila wadsworthia]|uniref:rod shape-determining protein n=1 Tax=Bilophila wadsworthia TaxID=35833 RepID=UPI00307B3CAE
MLRKHIAVDLGTANTLVFVQSQGIVINEPSVVAVDTINERVIAVGKEAKDYIGKTPQRISTIRPLRDGVIADFDAAQALIATFLKKVIGSWPIKPDVVICVPTNITDVERRAVAEAATKAGARNVKLIEEPVAAAVGAGLPVLEPVGSMVVDIGGGTTDIAVTTLGSMACSTSLKLAGDALTAAVQRFVQEKYQIVVGENMAERIKIALGSVAPLPVPLSFEVSGKDLATASPRTIALSDTDTREAFQPITEKLVSAVMGILEVTPPELGADIMRQGMLLTGGGALLRGFADRITRATRIPVYVDSDPLTTVLRGAGITLDDPEKYRDLLIEC